MTKGSHIKILPLPYGYSMCASSQALNHPTVTSGNGFLLSRG